MSPFAASDGHDGPRLVDEAIPCAAAMVEGVVIGAEDPVREPVVANELSDVLDRVQFRGVRRESDERYDFGHDMGAGLMPTGMVEQNDRVGVGGDMAGDFGEVRGHVHGDAAGHHDGRALALVQADRTEHVVRLRALIFGCGREGRGFVLARGKICEVEPDHRGRGGRGSAPFSLHQRVKCFQSAA